MPARAPGTRPPLRAEAVHVDPVPEMAARPVADAPDPRPPATAAQIEQFLSRPQGNLRVGVLHPDVAQAIGAASREVQFSADTAEKQALRHPDLTAGDYAAVASIMAAPDLAVADAAGRVVLFKQVGRLLYAAVKRTADGGETYLVSLFRARAKDVVRLAKRGTILTGSVEALLKKGE